MTTTALAEAAPRVYADTSVFGGVFDEEFANASLAFFDRVAEGRITLVVSAIVRDEALRAPAWVAEFYGDLAIGAETVDVTPRAEALARAYMARGVVTARWEADALHVALATVSMCAAIVSWNFSHIVHLGRMPLYNEVNRAEGYTDITIMTPEVAVHYESTGRGV